MDFWIKRFQLDPNYEKITAAYAQVIALAFQCDRTNIAAVSLGPDGARNKLPDIYNVPTIGGDELPDSNDGGAQHHGWSHKEPSERRKKALTSFYNWYSQRAVSIYRALSTTNNALGKPIMDDTVILWVSELGGDPKAHEWHADVPHQQDNLPLVALAGKNTGFKTGRSIDGENNPKFKHRAFQAVAKHMGVTLPDDFGDGAQTDKEPWDKIYG